MSQNLSAQHTDEEQVEMLIDNLLVLYRQLRKSADGYSDLHAKNNNSNEEMLNAANELMGVKNVYENACNAVCHVLNEIKNNGYRFEIKIVKTSL